MRLVSARPTQPVRARYDLRDLRRRRPRAARRRQGARVLSDLYPPPGAHCGARGAALDRRPRRAAGRGLPGQRAIVVGGGPIGAMFCALLTAAGASVTVVEPVRERAELAAALGAVDVVAPDAVHGLEAQPSSSTRSARSSARVELVARGGRVLLFGMNEHARAEVAQSRITRDELTSSAPTSARTCSPTRSACSSRGTDRLRAPRHAPRRRRRARPPRSTSCGPGAHSRSRSSSDRRGRDGTRGSRPLPERSRRRRCGPRTFTRYVGGFAGNVATGLARLGVRAAIVSRVGDEGHGDSFATSSSGEGVDTPSLGSTVLADAADVLRGLAARPLPAHLLPQADRAGLAARARRLRAG